MVLCFYHNRRKDTPHYTFFIMNNNIYKVYFQGVILNCQHYQHFLNAKTVHENEKNQAKKLKVYGENIDFNPPPHSLENVWFVHS